MQKAVPDGVAECAPQDDPGVRCGLRRSTGGDHAGRHALDVGRGELWKRTTAERGDHVAARVLLALPPGRRPNPLSLALEPSSQVVGHGASAGGLKGASAQLGAQLVELFAGLSRALAGHQSPAAHTVRFGPGERTSPASIRGLVDAALAS